MSAAPLAGLAAAEVRAGQTDSAKPVLRVGLVTDIHYADKPEAINRYYRQSARKLREAVDRFNEWQMDFVIELGDLIDAADSPEDELAYLKTIEAEYARCHPDRHYVLGNHCVWALTKKRFLEHCGGKEAFYSFDRGDFHFIVLDACYRVDGVPYGERNFHWTDTDIPPEEREWLKADLKRTEKPSVVFVHQRVDVENNYGIKSAPVVRSILEESRKVLAVFQGHSHRNDYREIGGIHYCTLAALVEGSGEENNSYGALSFYADGSMKLEGFRRQQTYPELRNPNR